MSGIWTVLVIAVGAALLWREYWRQRDASRLHAEQEQRDRIEADTEKAIEELEGQRCKLVDEHVEIKHLYMRPDARKATLERAEQLRSRVRVADVAIDENLAYAIVSLAEAQADLGIVEVESRIARTRLWAANKLNRVKEVVEYEEEQARLERRMSDLRQNIDALKEQVVGISNSAWQKEFREKYLSDPPPDQQK
jgi:hypothetical protein